LSSGRDTARPCWLAFGAPTNGSNKGGLADTYAEDGREREDSLALERLWPGVVEYREKKNGRSDAKIHWRRMRGHA
jgi:hypothetical protein